MLTKLLCSMAAVAVVAAAPRQCASGDDEGALLQVKSTHGWIATKHTGQPRSDVKDMSCDDCHTSKACEDIDYCIKHCNVPVIFPSYPLVKEACEGQQKCGDMCWSSTMTMCDNLDYCMATCPPVTESAKEYCEHPETCDEMCLYVKDFCANADYCIESCDPFGQGEHHKKSNC